jgi:hypothetical protein
MDLLAVGLAVWALYLAKRPGAPRWLRGVPWVLVAGFVVSFGGTLLGLKHAFDSVGAVPADRRAQALADGISRAMSFTLYGVVVDAVMLVVLAVMTWRTRAAPAPQPAPPGPPRE